MRACKAQGREARAAAAGVRAVPFARCMQPAAERSRAYLSKRCVRSAADSGGQQRRRRDRDDARAISRRWCGRRPSPVRWVETVRHMAARGVTHVVECGPGKVLAGLTKRIDAATCKSFALADRAVARGRRCEALKATCWTDKSRWSPAPRAASAARSRWSWRGRAPRWSAPRPREEGARSANARDAGIGAGTCSTCDDAAQSTPRSRRSKELGDVAILVNNAGITRDNLLLRMKDDGVGRRHGDQPASRCSACRRRCCAA